MRRLSLDHLDPLPALGAKVERQKPQPVKEWFGQIGPDLYVDGNGMMSYLPPEPPGVSPEVQRERDKLRGDETWGVMYGIYAPCPGAKGVVLAALEMSCSSHVMLAGEWIGTGAVGDGVTGGTAAIQAAARS